MRKPLFVLVCAVVLTLGTAALAQAQVPLPILIHITKAEDERRWDNELAALLAHRNAPIRKRALLAAGRIGNEECLPQIGKLLQDDTDPEVRAMAAFAIGEVESINAAHLLIAILKNNNERGELRARALEALGKIAAALPAEQQARQVELAAVIREALEVEATKSNNQLTVLLGLTAALRARAANAGPTITKFLTSPDGRIRSDAANVLARLRLKDGNELLRKLAYEDPDPNVRANATRVLGATEDKDSFDVILGRATHDPDTRVRVSSIRALASLKDPRAAEALLKRIPWNQNELLEIATTLGRVLPQKYDQPALAWLNKANEKLKHTAPEIEIALIRIAPATYLSDLRRSMNITDWRAGAAIANALGEIGGWPDSLKAQSDLTTSAESLVRKLLAQTNIEYAIPDVLRALATFKPRDLTSVLIAHLQKSDVIVRGTAADLLGDQPPSDEITRALTAAWPRVEKDSLNDAALSILDSLAKQKTAAANEPIKMAMGSPDYLVRRRAATLLKANGTGDFFRQAGIVQTRNTSADYRRALSRINRRVYAVVTTTKGSFTIELLPSEAPLTVDNFVQLARRNYYRDVTIHRVVPNFVIQDGDPRGDGNGGPGYQIRCEINQVPYDRAVLGMALSGKDTGGSQWFVTHAPQPHLDGGYTVFGRVTAGMNVVDSIERGDVVKSVVIRQVK
jgi:cyclophilin family peptidyl-prolyl cis-trans isomerase/HEAT repeat protein